MVRTAVRLVVASIALALTACGEEPASAPPPPPPAPATDAPTATPEPRPLPEGPLEATLDDEVVLAAVVAAAAGDGNLPESYAMLPPRVSPVRVAVRAVHDHLLGVREAAASWEGLLRALGSLSGCRSQTDAAALGPLVEAWRTWTQADREAEGALAERTTRALDLLRAPGPVDAAGLARLLTAPPKAPAKSPADATLFALRAAHLALTAKDPAADGAVDQSLRAARERFDALGWPGGTGVVLDFVAAALQRTGDAAARLRSIVVANHAMEAYGASKDSVRAAQVLLDLAADARRNGEVPRAEGLAKNAEEALASAGVRGGEVVDAAFFRAWTLQALGRHEDCLAALDRILREIEASRLDPAQRAPVMERRATSLYVLARFDEALAAADAGAAAYDEFVRIDDPERERLRAGLDELAAECLVELGRAKEGAERHLRASERHAKLPGGARSATAGRLLAARALVRGGDRDAALGIVRGTLADTALPPSLRAQAASVLRDAGAIDDARRELDRAVADGGPGIAKALVEEQARLEAAAGNRVEARRLFAEAEANAATAGDGNPAGFPAARVLLDWARMEEADGDLESAARLADRAVHHLSTAGMPMELDRAQGLFTALARRLLAFSDAERVTVARLTKGIPGPVSRRLDAQVDLFLVRIERAGAGGGDEGAAGRLAEALGALPLGAVRDVAEALAHPATSKVPPEDATLPARLWILREAASLHDADPADLVAFARRTPVSEPEIRRWALARAVTPREGVGARRVDPCEWSDLRRGEEPVTEARLREVLAPDEAFVLIEPVGAWTRVVWTTREKGGERAAMGDLAVPRFWDAVHVERTRSHVEGAGAAVMAAGLREALAAARAAGAKRLTISLAAPLGPLPFEVLPWSEDLRERTLFDVFDVAVAASAHERVAAAARPDDALDADVLRSVRAPLESRRAFVAAAPADEAASKRFADAVRAVAAKGLTTPLALRTLKESLRAASAEDTSPRVGVPLWAAFVLRGAW